jgi:hypothetical protein
MKVLPTGDFMVEASEIITFTVKRKNTPCKTGFDRRGKWQSCGNVETPDANTRVTTCTATTIGGDQSSCTITVDFRNDATGAFDPADQYHVTITGSRGGSFTEAFTPPPVLNGNTYHFTVE